MQLWNLTKRLLRTVPARRKVPHLSLLAVTLPNQELQRLAITLPDPTVSAMTLVSEMQSPSPTYWKRNRNKMERGRFVMSGGGGVSTP
jgi:hypothetical protein